MRYCPNSTCPYAQRHHRSAVYADVENTCHDCGTTLLERGPVSAGHLSTEWGLKTDGQVHPYSREKWALTILAPMALLLFGFIPLLPRPAFAAAASYSFFGGRLNYGAGASFLAVGLSGFVIAFVSVELFSALVPKFQHLRNDKTGRNKLERIALGVGSLFTLVISIAFARHLGNMGSAHGILRYIAPFIVSHLLIAVLLWATRMGRANAISIYFALQMLLALGAKFAKGSVQTGGAADSIHNLVIVFGSLIVLALMTDRVFEEKPLLAGRSKSSNPSSDMPFSSVPIVGLSAIGAGVILMQCLSLMIAVLRLFSSFDQDHSIAFLFQRNNVFIVLALAAPLFFLFAHRFWPSIRIMRAMSSVTGDNVSKSEVNAGRKNRLIKEGLLLAFVGFLAQTYFSLGILNYIAVVSLVAIARDLRAERHAEKLHGALIFVGRLSRPWEAAVLIESMKREATPVFVHVRGLWHRSIFQIFAPLIALDVFAPPDQAPEVEAAIEKIREVSRSRQ